MKNDQSSQLAAIMQAILANEPADQPIPDGDIYVMQNHVHFYSAITPASVLRLTIELEKLVIESEQTAVSNRSSAQPVHLHIHSPGGQVHAGFIGYDKIISFRNRAPIYTYVEGMAASAATFLSIAGSKRFITPTSFMLIHEPSGMIAGQYTKITEEFSNLKKLVSHMEKIYLTHSNFEVEKLREFLKHDWFISAEECLEYGLVDEII